MRKRNILNLSAGCVMLFPLLFFCSLKGVAQENVMKSEYSYKQYTTHDGLHHMMTASVFQDKLGYLWIGTYRGFARFDGYTFTPFLSETGLWIERFEDVENGQIRAFGANNCYVVDKNDSVREIHLTDSLHFNPYTSQLLPPGYLVYETKNYTTNDGDRRYLMQLQNDSLKICLLLPGLNNIKNPRIFWDKRSDLLYIPEKERITVYNMRTKEVSHIENIKNIETFCLHSRLGLLAIGYDGIFKIEHLKAELIIPHTFTILNKQMLETDDGGLLIRDFHSIYRISENRIEELYHDEGMILWDMTLDKDNNLWVATNNGLFNFFRFNFQIRRIEGHAIQTIVQDGAGTFWMGGFKDDLFTLSGDILRKQTIPFPGTWEWTSFSGTASCIGNMLYFPRKEGVVIWDDKRFAFANIPLNGIYNKVLPFGNDYLLSSQDALYFIDKYGRSTRVIDDLRQSNIYNITVDNQKRIIVSGEKGLTIVTDTVHLIQQQNTENTLALCNDAQGNIWSGSNNCLNLLRGDSIVTVHRFKENSIVGLMPVDEHHLLIAMLKGFYIMDLLSYFGQNKVSLLYYNHLNGMTGFEPISNSLYMDKEGCVWMPTTDCIVSFDPQRLLRSVSPPTFHIQSVETSANNVLWNKTEMGKTVFSHKNNNIRFSFIGINYSATENVRYHYRLRGFQNDWSEPVKQREVTFNNLPPRDYVFEIYSDSGTDESRSETQTFAFSIKPAFWQTAWFLVAGIAFLMLASAGVALYIQRRKNKALLEKLRAEKELNELRISSIRLKAIPHFNANVLAAIEYYIANRTKEEAMHILGIYSDFTFKTLSDVDKAARPLSEELAYVKMYLDLEKIRFLDKFDFQINVDDNVDKDAQLPNMILHTYCENAVKHGLMPLKTGGILSINVSQRDRIVFVSVEDNGVGRTSSAQNPHLHSSKQGLSILSRQIEIYNKFNQKKINQQVEDLYKDGKPSGTAFTVDVPVDFEYVN